MRLGRSVALMLLAAGCVQSDNPAEGGFYSGIAGLAGGGYDDRVAERQASLEASQAEAARLDRELAALKSQLTRQRADLRSEGVQLSPQVEGRLSTVLGEMPSGADPSARTASLRSAIADARRLSEELASLSG